MAVQQIKDVTAEFNANGAATIDLGGNDYAIVHLVTPSAAVTFKTSNDANAITGASDGSATSAINFSNVQGTDLSSGSAVTSLNASGILRFGYVGRFLKLDGGAGVTCVKAIIRLVNIG